MTASHTGGSPFLRQLAQLQRSDTCLEVCLRDVRAVQCCLAEERKRVVQNRLIHTLGADVTRTLTGFASNCRNFESQAYWKTSEYALAS